MPTLAAWAVVPQPEDREPVAAPVAPGERHTPAVVLHVDDRVRSAHRCQIGHRRLGSGGFHWSGLHDGDSSQSARERKEQAPHPQALTARDRQMVFL